MNDNRVMIEHFIGNTHQKNINLYYCGYQQCAPDHNYGPTMRDHYLIHYIVSGMGTFETMGSCNTLQAGDSFILFPNVPGYYKPDKSDPWVYYWAGFNGDLVDSYLNIANISVQTPIHRHEDSAEIVELFHRMLQFTAETHISNETFGAGLLIQLLSHYLKERADSGHGFMQQETSQKEWYVKQAIQYIEANYDRKVTISDIAKQIGLDRSYFTKLFREQVKISPYRFILDYRLEKAVRMLIHTREAVQTIAQAVGFDDPVYFAKVFKQRKGISPSLFRQHNPDKRILTRSRSDQHPKT